jgi:hypothetical protein
MAIMRLARELAHVETIEHQDSAERALNKLARTYAMQMEALKRYRTGGEQKVTVQHVPVSEGKRSSARDAGASRHSLGKDRDHAAGADRYAPASNAEYRDRRAGVIPAD